MKTSLLPSFFTMLILIACNNANTGNDPSADVKATTHASVTDRECYGYSNNNDTIRISVTRTGENFEGTLVYMLKEKDKNVGTIKGTVNNNVFLGDYRFMSEGVTSVRQVAFRKEGNYLVEGYGDIDMVDNKSVFKNPSTLDFNSSMKLEKMECE